MHKRLGVECKREVPALRFNEKHYGALALALIGSYGFAPAADLPAELPEHSYLDWQPLHVADALLISPYATEDYEQRVRDAVSSINPAAVNLVELSILSERRYPVNF